MHLLARGEHVKPSKPRRQAIGDGNLLDPILFWTFVRPPAFEEAAPSFAG